MGLKGFYPLLAKCGYVPTDVQLTELSGRTIAVDADYWLYKCLHGYTSGRQDPVPTMVNVLQQWCQQAAAHGIRLILVFSGEESVPEKAACRSSRALARKKLEARAAQMQQEADATDDLGRELYLRDRIATLKDAARTVSTSMRQECQDRLQSHLTTSPMHTIRRAVSEADFLLMLLSEQGACELVATEDADILACGASSTLRNFTGLLNGHGVAQQYTRADVLRALQLGERESIFQLAALLHCDYQCPISGVGPMTALRYIRKYGTVEAFLRSRLFTTRTKKTNRPKFQLPGGTIEDYIRQTRRTLDIFQSRPDEVSTRSSTHARTAAAAANGIQG